MLVDLLIPVATFALNVVLNFFLLWRLKDLGIVKGLAISTAFSLVLGVAAQIAISLDLQFGLMNLLIFLSLSYCFFHFVHIPVASVRIRVLAELANRGSLSREQILATYGAEHILDMRLARLTSTRQLSQTNGVYRTLRKKIYHVALGLSVLKRFVQGGRRQS